MTVLSPPTIVPNSGHPPEDDLDGLLRAYFQAEMPDLWPSFEAPAPRNGVLPLRRRTAPNANLWRSRLALAASILLLLATAFFVASGWGNNARPQDSGLQGPLTGDNSDHLKPTTKGLFIPVDKNGANSIHEDLPLDFPMK
jgi:hypothetical protein